MGRRALTGLLAGLFFLPFSVGVAAAAPTDPAQWPNDLGLDPELTATPHTIRFAGADRYGTNLAMSLALRGKGGFPFTTSDRTSNNAANLAAASGWWGAGSCPRSIIVVAGDTFADALSAASLSDPTDLSNQPLLRRVAAANPSFDPIGGMDRPDTASAPIVVTLSGRSGASALSRTAVATATDLAKGGCTTAREAIIVGGPRAVPTQVENELLTHGFREVFRVAGVNRYETAANVAVALGTEPPPADVSTCTDSDQTDGSTRIGFYGNAVAEFRDPLASPPTTACRLLSRSVVLADGETGADALAAGWWTSRWQVPVLLTGPDGTLPAATQKALTTIEIDTVIVLGGIGRIPEATANEAARLATAVVGRVAGSDRYATSVEMAKAFGGWYPGGTFSAEMLCVAASSGTGDQSAGWPDALAAGPWCGRLSGSARTSPSRILPSGATAGGTTPAHHAVPILLVPSRATNLPAGMSDLLARASFPSIQQAFAVVFGGQREITPEAERRLDSLLGADTEPPEKVPTLTEAFGTRLDLTPAFQSAGTGTRRLCVSPGGATNYRWLSVTRDVSRSAFVLEQAVTTALAPGGVSVAQCLVYDDTLPGSALTAVSSSGGTSPSISFDFEPARDLSVNSEISQAGTSTVQPSGARQLDFSGVSGTLTLRAGDQGTRITAAELHLEVNQPPAEGTATTFTGSGLFTTSRGRSGVSVHGLATVTSSVIELRGLADVQAAGGGRFRGGFRASITLSGDGSTASVRWQVDGLPV